MVEFQKLIDVVARLRGPDGCPWDKEQTHRSLTPFLIEEAYECADAIESGESDEAIADELGDVLFQVVLHSQLAAEEKRFTLATVVQKITEKMVRRHPHVFTENSAPADGVLKTSVSTADDVLKQWDQIKATEKQKTSSSSRFDFGVSETLPALIRAAKIGEKTKRLKFDWPHVPGSAPVLKKIHEELAELEEALTQFPGPSVPLDEPTIGSSRNPVRHEIGDLLFSIAQLARHQGIDPEQCLREANHRFETRFQCAHQQAKLDHREWLNLTDSERESYWDKAKKAEKKNLPKTN